MLGRPFFGALSCPKLKKCASPIHCSEPAPHSSLQSCDTVVEKLPAVFSQPTALVPVDSVVPPVPRCELPQTGFQTIDSVSAVPSGLSRSWCAPVKVYTEPFCKIGSPVHSKSLPLSLVDIQRDSPIWPPVSPTQIPSQDDLLEANLLFSDTTGVLSPSNENDIVPAVSAPEVLPLPTVSIICETPSPKSRSPPRSQSPNVLDIVLAGDISLPDSPDLVELKQAWPGQITGSPPHPAFPPPSYAEIVAEKTKSNRCPLFNCADCGKKFYTKHGLVCHICSCKPPVPSSVVPATNAPVVVVQKKTTKRNRKNVKPPRFQRDLSNEVPTVVQVSCIFCEKNFHSQSALEEHYDDVHQVKPQRQKIATKPLVKGNPQQVVKTTVQHKPILKSKVVPVSVKADEVQPQKPKFQCTLCDVCPSSKKGLFYHMREFHRQKVLPPLTGAGPSTSSMNERLPLSISGNVLQASFPMAAIVPCPVKKCKKNFASGNWNNAVPAIRSHLSSAHSTVCSKTYNFCNKCANGFFEQPSEHACLLDSYILEAAPPQQFCCPSCKTYFLSQVELSKHITLCKPKSSSPQLDDPPPCEIIVERSVRVKQSFPSPPPAGVDLVEDSIRYFFPLPQTLCCPVPRCSHSFTTRKWYTTNTSLKRHLSSFHRRPNLLVQFWCLACEKRIVQPARHRCLKGASLVVNSGQGTWQCDECEFKATTKVGLDNHMSSHRKEAAAASMPKISIPPSISKKKKSKRAKLVPISSGDPGCARLAPPASPQPSPQTVDESSVSGRADVAIPTVLDCFIEALDTLLEVDEISERFSHFENLVQNISETVQQHFNLVRPQPNSSLPLNKGADLNNPQVVQRGYRWNRRKCIRHITQANASRCPISRDAIFTHFQQVWRASPVQLQPNPVDAPTRPPIVETLARDFVLECLKSCENSAPGPDMISYKHWREIDPNCVILTKLFNICLKFSDVPNSWKRSSTVLIPKCSEPALLSDWRPISLSDTAYKLFSKCLARKLSDWCEVHEALSPAQKGFSPFDGVIEHNFILCEHLETARRDKCERFVAWIDIANAFGSIPHPVLLEALLRNGVDQDFVRLVQNIYTNAETQVLTSEGPTAPLPLLSGVKQG
ncbi:retrovirus-related Pol polyprotein from type-1 retrotransposable element R2 [Trichonephila clavata]|uniref:Retrovirus-related Pol polyprotein from type-1 retrotransposable element R2 n=1 Tax=Trichonephila clavata TaxID=2740835 RepID=A0A8X6GW31_TRICU|nr:retrovirus-related Pol polyprotein from type-1 retrotransposable element R2 [Trichonephila clavata]